MQRFTFRAQTCMEEHMLNASHEIQNIWREIQIKVKLDH